MQRPSGRIDAEVVKAGNFRCLAYKDDAGKWRNYFHPEEVLGSVEVIPLD